jgi:hypothetical protein
MGTIAFSVGTAAASTSTVIVGSLAGGISARLSSLDQLIVFLSCGVASHSHDPLQRGGQSFTANYPVVSEMGMLESTGLNRHEAENAKFLREKD